VRSDELTARGAATVCGVIAKCLRATRSGGNAPPTVAVVADAFLVVAAVRVQRSAVPVRDEGGERA